MQGLLECFLFGAANSLHCLGMCGPLAACGAAGAAGTAAAYHVGRATSYATAGAVAGGVGAGLGSGALDTPVAWISGLFALGLIGHALGLQHRIPGLRGGPLGALLLRTQRRSLALPARRRAMALGLLTPLLPCGLLLSVYPAAMLAGSWHGGALALLGFAAGTLPALGLAQLNVGWLRSANPTRRARLQQGLLLATAVVLLWRAATTLQGSSCCGS